MKNKYNFSLIKPFHAKKSQEFADEGTTSQITTTVEHLAEHLASQPATSTENLELEPTITVEHPISQPTTTAKHPASQPTTTVRDLV